MDYRIIEKIRIFSEFFKVDRVKLLHDCFHQGPLEVVRYHLERPQVVAVMVENTEQNSIIMVKQFRYSSTKHSSTRGWTLEIVGGLIDPGESPEQCALRETLEETGYRLPSIEKWTAFHPSLGVSDEYVHLYYGQVTSKDRIETGGGLAHENEDLEVLEMSLVELMAQVESGQLTDSKSVIALLWLSLRKQQRADSC